MHGCLGIMNVITLNSLAGTKLWTTGVMARRPLRAIETNGRQMLKC